MQANPRQTLGIQTNAQVHFDSEREVNLVVSQDKSSGAWKVYGDTQRIVSKVSRDGVTNLDSDTIQYLNYLIGAASGCPRTTYLPGWTWQAFASRFTSPPARGRHSQCPSARST